MLRRLLGLLNILAVTAVATAAAGAFFFLAIPGERLEQRVRIDVAAGEPFRTTAERLEKAGLIPNGRALQIYARLTGADRNVKRGPYEFQGGLSPLELLGTMERGESLLVRVTIPEGWTLRQIAAEVARVELADEAKIIELATDPIVARELGVPAETLEGYLFPETYSFSPLAPPRRIVEAMVARFFEVFDDEMLARAKELDLTQHEVVTLASIVEKETGQAAERPLIGSVFSNRLRIGMPLQSDPTVIYGIPNFDGNITRRHLRTPTPYNTYKMRGLPAGPIASPGLGSLLAVLHPADSKYLYFVSKNDGSHQFSTNLRDHERAVDEYQRRRRKG